MALEDSAFTSTAATARTATAARRDAGAHAEAPRGINTWLAARKLAESTLLARGRCESMRRGTVRECRSDRQP